MSTTARILDGKATAAQIKAELAERVTALRERGVTPGLGTVLVGDDPGSHSYVAGKHRDCAEVGITSVRRDLPDTITQEELEAVLDELNDDDATTGYIVQLPLPAHIDTNAILGRIDPAKDADGLHPTNLGLLALGVTSAPLACTPAGILAMLTHYEVPVEGRDVVIVGRGPTIGRPLSLLLSQKRAGANAAVTVVHTGVPNWAEHTRRADIVVGGAGVPNMIGPDHVRPGAAVVGAGLTWEGKRIISDVDESVAEVAAWVTPRRGGVGPTTVAMLLSNAAGAARRNDVRAAQRRSAAG